MVRSKPALASMGFRKWSIFGASAATLYLGSTVYLFPPFFNGTRGGAGTTTGESVLLKNHCCAMPTTLPVSQYNTSPADCEYKKNTIISGINCITFGCSGSP